MPIEMPKGLPFSVDTWTPQSDAKRHHFLTHAHRDHLSGISSRSSHPVYATKITKSIVLRYFGQVDGSVFVGIEVGERLVVKDIDGDFTVTAFDANHCPGAVMFLFEGEFGNILHTGDCRLTPDCLQNFPMKFISKKGKDNAYHLDYLFLDCTFGRCHIKIPSKESSIQQVINCIWKHPNAPVVYLACDMLGQEEILIEVSRTFGSKIYLDETNNSDCYHILSLIAPEILSEDATSRFQVIEGFPRLSERASQQLTEAHAKLQPGPLFIRPSTQWYANNNQLAITQVDKLNLSEAMKDEFGIWHVCYSMHSSRDELEWALHLLQPKWVISTTPPCRAMELSYVKKHCFKTRISRDDPLWKLLKVGNGNADSEIPSSVIPESNTIGISSVSGASEICMASEEVDHFETQSSTNSITLFGRARLGLSDTDLFLENIYEKSDVCTTAKEELLQENVLAGEVDIVRSVVLNEQSTSNEIAASESSSNVTNITDEKSLRANISTDNTGSEKLVKEEIIAEKNVNTESVKNLEYDEASINIVGNIDLGRKASCVESTSDLNDNLKKYYRSLNVPIPRPLPSLVELMGATKRIRVGSKSSSPSRLN